MHHRGVSPLFFLLHLLAAATLGIARLTCPSAKKEGAVSPLSVFPAGFYSKINEKTTVCGITRLRAAWCAS